MNKISVIVPIYNVKEYIFNTLMSILNQSFQNFELILVNDGTKDNSIEIAQNLLNNKNREYKLINQENKGLSSARNVGIKNASTEWVICIDSDDLLERDFLLLLYTGTTESKSDVGICEYNKVKASNCILDNYVKKSGEIISKNNMIRKFLKRKINIVVPAMLIRKSLIDNNHITYDEQIKFSEDQIYIWRVLFCADYVYYNHSKLYNYLQRANSIMYYSPKENILTGYIGIQNMISLLPNDVSKHFKSMIVSRWVFGAMQTVIRSHDYNSTLDISVSINTKKHLKTLLVFPDIRVVFLSLIGLIRFKTLYNINRLMAGKSK